MLPERAQSTTSRALPRICLTLLPVLLVAAGCASGARTDAMTAAVSPGTIVADASPLRGAFRVGTVTGGNETNPLWKSNVSNENFRAALEQSLALHAMTARDQGRYLVNAELASLDQPFGGFDLTVTAKVHYTVVALADQAVKLDTTIESPYTAEFGDALLGPERLRLANEGAMHENIAALIKRLIYAARPGQPLSL